MNNPRKVKSNRSREVTRSKASLCQPARQRIFRLLGRRRFQDPDDDVDRFPQSGILIGIGSLQLVQQAATKRPEHRKVSLSELVSGSVDFDPGLATTITPFTIDDMPGSCEAPRRCAFKRTGDSCGPR